MGDRNTILILQQPKIGQKNRRRWAFAEQSVSASPDPPSEQIFCSRTVYSFLCRFARKKPGFDRQNLSAFEIGVYTQFTKYTYLSAPGVCGRFRMSRNTFLTAGRRPCPEAPLGGFHALPGKAARKQTESKLEPK